MKGNRLVYKSLSGIVLAALLLTSLPSQRNALAALPQESPAKSGEALAIPDPLPGEPPTASVTVNPYSGYITQVVTVSGEISMTEAQVWIAWIYGDGSQTFSAAVVSRSTFTTPFN